MSKRNSRISAVPGSILTIGLDIGYGVVKAVTDDQVVMFPSVMGHAREIKFQQDEIAKRHPGDQISDDDGAWFVGDLALAQLPTGELLRLRGRTANESTMGNAFRLRLAKAAIGKLMQGMWNRDIVHIRIATGLPTDHMRDAADLKAALLGQHLIKTDTADLIANVTEVMVMPQPYGTIYGAALTETGEINRQHTYRRTGVCDVGTYTVDLALDDDGEFCGRRKRECRERGVHRSGADCGGAGTRLPREDAVQDRRGSASDRDFSCQWAASGLQRSRRRGADAAAQRDAESAQREVAARHDCRCALPVGRRRGTGL